MGNTSTSTRYQILTQGQDTRHRAINPDINQDKTRQDAKRNARTIRYAAIKKLSKK